MNNNKINTYIPKKNDWKSISITKNAIKQILFLINLDSDNKGIRLGIKKSGCAGFRYTMKLVKNSEIIKQDRKEIVFFYKNVYIYISTQEIPFLEGVQIDFVKNNINTVFKFHNAKLDKFCGCGESFAIN
ncbi:iron-sulfur cluster assembly accessory protein [Buchnera aphidicola]|uniref:Iron-sulfur cluster assembly accessory protein n=1 Tax=Buchnera aphidicola (Artemisaphis artemisicola) TaxID=1241836 RepID=A0A4D6XI58_9GAMM|nr:iron-sulfur cluster assembly accessory protein [Buchnera aphidicola]QCI15813.1 iron-sulfur cluster assembly accessory protein [Buchnera aphidicola (Artemisaphis artemisicola)]